MTEKAIKLIKELAELNEKVRELELQLKKELNGEPEKLVFDTKEEAIKELSKINEEAEQEEDKYYEDPYEEDYVWEDPTNEACWDCNNPRCKKGRLNNIYLRDILPQGNFVEYLFRHGNRTVCDLMYDAKDRAQTHSVNFDNVMRCFCSNEDLYRLYRELLIRDIPMINYNRYNIDYSKNIEDSDFKKSVESYVDNGIISVAVGNALRRANCYSIGDIKLLKDLNELKKTRTIGKKTFEKIMEFIEKEKIL